MLITHKWLKGINKCCHKYNNLMKSIVSISSCACANPSQREGMQFRTRIKAAKAIARHGFNDIANLETLTPK